MLAVHWSLRVDEDEYDVHSRIHIGGIGFSSGGTKIHPIWFYESDEASMRAVGVGLVGELVLADLGWSLNIAHAASEGAPRRTEWTQLINAERWTQRINAERRARLPLILPSFDTFMEQHLRSGRDDDQTMHALGYQFCKVYDVRVTMPDCLFTSNAELRIED